MFKVSLLNVSSILSSKLEDDPLYTSYASMMAKVHLVFFLSLQSSRFPLTSRHVETVTLGSWPGTWVMAWAPGFAQFTCFAGNINKPSSCENGALQKQWDLVPGFT